MSPRHAWFRYYHLWTSHLRQAIAGMDPIEAWFAFEEGHDGRCAICIRQVGRHHLVVDHDHRTGLVRGLLCRGCNVIAWPSVAHRRLALWRDDNRDHIAFYCQNPPAAMVGLRGIYESSWGHEPAPDLPERIWHASSEGLWRRYDDLWTNNASARVGL